MGKFVIELKNAIGRIQGKQDLAMRKIALTAYQKIQAKTPVDTGQLRRSWTVSLNSEPSNFNGNSQAIMQATINDRIVIATNKPYAPMLEYGLYPKPPKKPTGKTRQGYSVQAPQGMVRITIQEVKAWIEQNPTLGIG
jgi:hypothetical protein